MGFNSAFKGLSQILHFSCNYDGDNYYYDYAVSHTFDAIQICFAITDYVAT